MIPNDLRQFLDILEEAGECRRVAAEVDWNLEAGALARACSEQRGPALLLEKIKDYPAGYRIASNFLGVSKPHTHTRLALALGLPPDTPTLELVREFATRSQQAIKPVLVESGPCKENIIKGDDIDIFKLPVPFVHGTDGGRYVGTWSIDVTRNPQTGVVNWGTYRHQAFDRQHIGWYATGNQHGPSIFLHQYEPRNEPMPMAIVIGADPISHIASASQIPAGVAEVDVAGALRGKPVELVKCETIDLEVPANAEIVLEGVVLPGERRPEGSFGEFPGYDAGAQIPRAVFEVRCITHRNNPILTMANIGKPWDEFHVVASITMSAMIHHDLEQRGVPFKAVYVPPPILAVIIAAEPQYAGFVHTVAGAIWSSKSGIMRPYLFVVGEDVDITNMEDVFWCLVTRTHPERDIHISKHTPSVSLFPFLNPEERAQGYGAKVLFDATFPYELPRKERPTVIDLQNGWPEAIQQKIKSRWKEYGLD